MLTNVKIDFNLIRTNETRSVTNGISRLCCNLTKGRGMDTYKSRICVRQLRTTTRTYMVCVYSTVHTARKLRDVSLRFSYVFPPSAAYSFPLAENLLACF